MISIDIIEIYSDDIPLPLISPIINNITCPRVVYFRNYYLGQPYTISFDTKVKDNDFCGKKGNERKLVL